MGGDDVGEEGLAGFEVVVVAVHTHRDEVVDLTLGEHAEGGGDVDVDRGADRGDALAHLLHELVVRAADGGDDAELTRAGRGGCLAARTSSGMLSHTERTGEVNWPDCEQKWQSSGQPRS